jgi:hypothetical protein
MAQCVFVSEKFICRFLAGKSVEQWSHISMPLFVTGIDKVSIIIAYDLVPTFFL